MDVLQALETTRAIRHLKKDPVPKDIITKLIYYATCASNPGNSQLWEFFVLQDPHKKKIIGDKIEEGFRTNAERFGVDLKSLSGFHLATHLSEAPVIIFIGGRNEYPSWSPDERFIGSACYPAGQNLIIAARAFGLGSTFTTFHGLAGNVIHETLSIPEEVSLRLTIPIGYPEREFTRVKRKPVDDVIHWV